MTQRWRLSDGGAIDRSRPLAFTYDGVRYEGYAGDTLASALLANGVHLVARSFKYHRPRGIVTAGVEEPCALVQLGEGARSEPNTRATTVELFEGLVARSQNCWPSVRFDLGAIANSLSPILPAGFYYKTFKWPPTPRWWMRYEHFIRRAAGMGRAASAPDPDCYEHQYAHCDVLVIGGGTAGIAAARRAADSGARVIVCQQSAHFGGMLADTDAKIGERNAADWVRTSLDTLSVRADVTLLSRTTAFGYYDANLVAALERIGDHRPPQSESSAPRQRLWMIRAKAVVLASGAIERGIAYGNNDLPGTLLASAAYRYVRRHAVKLGTRAVVFTNNDSAYEAAFAMHAAGILVAGIVDARREPASREVQAARDKGIDVHAGAVIERARGRQRVHGVTIVSREDSKSATIDCDVIAVSGGYSPTVHLFSQARGTLRYDEVTASLVPDISPMAVFTAGAVNGHCDVARAIADGEAAADEALARAGMSPSRESSASLGQGANRMCVEPLWSVPEAHRAKSFVDLQNDVTVRDIALAAREGYDASEHLKRYTTLGMGTDQGKTGNVIGMGLLSAHVGRMIGDVGTTTFRPPYTPVTLGALPGGAHGAHVEPTRLTPMHEWHAQAGARFVNAGLWKRPHSYPRAGESEDDAARREARNVRENVGVVDVSTLGKIELQGRDVATFLNRVYVNRFDNLPTGRCRYGLMLRDDGIVRDDGTMSRLDATHYLMTTTTANAAAIMQAIERHLQVDWPDLDVHVTSVTEQWAAAALSGPKSRNVLERLVDIDVSNEALPFLGVARCRLHTAVGDVAARVFRMSYSGELAYEIHVPANRGRAMWQAVLDAGAAFGIMPYGTEAMNTLRVEKGHVVIGAEIDGRTTAGDLGMGRLVNADKWCIGKPLLDRPALTAADRWQLVGLTAPAGERIPRGGKIVADPDRALQNPMLGHVTSWCDSPTVGRCIALALVAAGRSRHGETLWAVSPLANEKVHVAIGPPVFVDPEGKRLRV